MSKQLNALAWQYYNMPFDQLCPDRRRTILSAANNI